MTIVVTIFYLEFIINMLLDLVYYIQIMIDATDIFMGMTILAISNTFVDMFVNGALAQQGYEIMAITGLFGGQMFNFLIGFSIGCLRKYFGSNKFKEFSLYKIHELLEGKDKEGFMTLVVLGWGVVTILILMIVLRGSQ